MIKHIINGEKVSSDESFDTINPATGKVITQVALGGQADIDAAVAAAKAAFPAWSKRPAAERAALMRKLGELIDQHVPEIAAMETQDCGQTIHTTGKVLIPRASHNFNFFAEICTHVDGECYPTDDHLNYTTYEPVGVCALISPWNVPFMTATWKVAPCLALGNTAVLKMSELSPLSANRLGELALQAGIPAGVLNVVHGYGSTVGDALVTHPDVRAISFTGSTATGNTIMSRGGLKKYSMELGGKSPVIIFEDAHPERAMDAALFMVFSVNGERCTAGSRILVQRSIYDEFVEKFAARSNNIKVGDPMDETTKIGPMISKEHLQKVKNYIEIGQSEGARLVAGGGTPILPAEFADGNWVEATVFADVDNSMRIAQEEIFGPVACLIPFEDEAEAIRIANDSNFGLSSYVWTENNAKALRVSKAMEAGMVFVNSQNIRDLRQPFGGTKGSGVGREGGHWSFDVFCEPKFVCMSLGEHRIPKWGV
ncbi:MAG: 5-carboxymethyl-2-hydroxymuconate semialdehyde dehydrogenase [Pseudomonadales bacterium]|nr:5-carboxymethyl-2-hydroxymuconate semialdehyde dehydrogenase [Pseudomonadales bacterium]NRA14152.1 5-carboxymethyl-2-hydroxymuconate semialdehyde dehydrogenase [Oceanospirillaceae bacterium]